jgi:alpha-N-arabinofuranosidase
MVKAGISIHKDQKIGRIHPFVFGHFLEHFPGQIYGGVYDEGSSHSDKTGFRTDVIKALRDLEVPVIRWPGGCYASGYHWMWGAVPRPERETRLSPCWRFQDSNRFGTPEFIELCRRTGAEPVICVGMGRGERHPTAEEAAAWVRYCNAENGPEADLRKRTGHPEPFNVTLWGLGNEVFAGIYDRVEDYGEDLLQFAKAMREADPRIRFIIVGAEQHWLDDWNERLLANDGVVRSSDWIAWHDYLHTGMCESRPDGRGKRKPYEKVMDHLLEVEDTIEMLIRLNREASSRVGKKSHLELAVDEWNELGWELFDNIPKNDLPETYTLAHAIYTAGFLNVMIRHAADVTMANYSPTVNTRGLIYAGSRGVVLRSTYYVFQMYRHCVNGQAVKTMSESPLLEGSKAPLLDAVGVIDEGKVRIFAANLHPEQPVQCHINFEGISIDGGTAVVLTGDSLDSYNDFGDSNRVIPKTEKVTGRGSFLDYLFPARSVSILSLDASL